MGKYETDEKGRLKVKKRVQIILLEE